MAQKILGVDIYAVATSTPANEPGIVVEVPVGGGDPDTTVAVANTVQAFPGALVRYVLATGTITAGNSIKIDTAAAAGVRSYSVTNTTAVTDRVEGVALVSAVVGQYFWAVTEGGVKKANVANAATAGTNIAASATAGRLGAVEPTTTATIVAQQSGKIGHVLFQEATNNIATIVLR